MKFAEDASLQHDVFISYSSKDRVRVSALASRLRAAGVNVWIDDSIAVGGSFRPEIQEALKLSKVAMVCWSRHSVESRWVQAEAETALEQGSYFPVLLNKADMPIDFKAFSAVDLSGWEPDAVDQSALSRLAEQLKGRIDRNIAAEALFANGAKQRRKMEAITAGVLFAAVAAAAMLLAQYGAPHQPGFAYGALAGLTLALSALATLSYAAITGRGFSGAAGWTRAGVGGLTAIAALVGISATAPGLPPGPLEATGPRRITMRHSHIDGQAAARAAADATTVSAIARLTFLRDGRRTRAEVRGLHLALQLGNRRYLFAANHFTGLEMGSTEGWIPNRGAISLPQIFAEDSPTDVRFLPEDPMTWKPFVMDVLEHGPNGFSAEMTVLFSNGDTIVKNCSASEWPAVLKQVADFTTSRLKTPNSIPVDCD